MQLKVAEKAVEAYAQLAQKNNTMIVPGNMSEVSALIGTAMALMKAKRARTPELRLTMAFNVLGTELLPCSYDPLTGFYRDGCCNTADDDTGTHVVCVKVTAEFLAFSREPRQRPVHAAPRVPLSRPEARRPLVPVRAALERGLRGRRGAAGGARRHARTRARLRCQLQALQARALDAVG